MKKLLILLFLSTSLSTFADSHLDFSLSGFCFQQPGIQDRGDVLYFPNKVVGITATSICVYKDAYGQYESKGELINGKKEGWWTWWKENGEVLKKEQYKEGDKIGYMQMTFNENSQIELEKIYLNGVLIGRTAYQYSDSGQLLRKSNYIGDKLIGKTEYFYDGNDRKWLEVNYKDGKLDGKVIRWHKNGQMKREEKHKDGVKHGEWTYWHENGQKFITGRYRDGKLHGRWTSWHDNGVFSGKEFYKDGVKIGEWTRWNRIGYMSKNGSYNSIGRRDGKWSYWFWLNTEEWSKDKPKIEKWGDAIYKNGKCISGDCDWFKDR